MAYTFDGTNQYLSTASAPATAVPLTMACWFRSTTASANQALMQINNSDGSNRFLMAANFAVANSPLRVFASGGGTSDQSDYTGLAANTTYHAAGVFASNTSRTAYLNGAAATAGTASVSVGSVDRMTIGTRYAAGAFLLYLNGWMAEVGVWSAALTTAEVASLAAGVSCRLVRPQSLVFYAPLIRDLIDYKGGKTITNNNTATVANHPRVYA